MSNNDLNEDNEYMISLIKKEKPFFISRLGSEIIPSLEYVISKKFFIPEFIYNNAGIYYNQENDIKIYYDNYFSSVLSSDGLAVFKKLEYIKNHEIYFTKKYNIHSVSNRILEPFYLFENKNIQDNSNNIFNIIPWTHHLKGKKVLIVSPFVESFQKQLSNGFKMFKNHDIFLEGQEFVFYKAFNTLAGNKIHKNWIETYNIMVNEITKLDFDVALLSCGGYGLIIGSFIKHRLNKSAIYIGGGLQLLFGVIGNRWINNETIKKIIKENDCKFIRPSENEIVKNLNKVEKGCYW